MSSDLERRLEGFFHELPQAEPEVEERALAASLGALRPTAPPRRGLRTAGVAFAAVFVLLAIAAGSLAAVGALHVTIGTKPRPTPARTQLSLPRGASGIAAVVDGRLSVVTRSGFRLQGLSVSAAALSPHAWYVAAGIGDSLVGLSPDGRRAWSQPAGGPVVAIAWAPFGNRIAYVVRAGRRLVLHVIWGNGRNDAVIDSSVRAVQPSWRADSLAFAYVGAGGRATVYDLAHASRRTVAGFPPGVVQLAFSPTAGQLALRSADRVGVYSDGRPFVFPRRLRATGIGWIGRNLLTSTGHDVVVQPIGILPAYRPLDLGARVVALTADGRRFVATLAGRSLRIVAGTRSHVQTVLQLRPGQRVDVIGIG
jgi:hypothetical protein